MNITSELYKKVIQYLNNEVSLSQFEDWFLPNLGEILSLPSCPALDLAGDIELSFAEMSNGNLTESAFRSAMRNTLESGTEFVFGEPISAFCISTSTGDPSVILLDDTIPPSVSDVIYQQVPA
jgi:hypothetical protein